VAADTSIKIPGLAPFFLVPAFFIKQSVSIGNGHKIESKKSTYKNIDLAHRAMAFQATRGGPVNIHRTDLLDHTGA